MGLKYALSRWLYKKLCFNYTQASRLHPYTIKLSSILRDSQLKAYAKISNNIREVEKTFEELKDNAVLDRFEDERIYDPDRRNKIADVKYTLFPHEDFIKDMRRFNEAYGSQKEKEKQVNFVGDEY
jgi:hypothetical protein